MAQMHDHPARGHFGVNKTHKWILKFYTWPGSQKDTKVFFQRCSVCVQTKHSTCQLVGLPTPLHVTKAPWQKVTINLVTNLPRDKGYTEVCTVVNRFSKETVLFPIMKNFCGWLSLGFPRSCLKASWDSTVSFEWPEPSVHLLVHIGSMQVAQYQVHSIIPILPSNRWTD